VSLIHIVNRVIRIEREDDSVHSPNRYVQYAHPLEHIVALEQLETPAHDETFIKNNTL